MKRIFCVKCTCSYDSDLFNSCPHCHDWCPECDIKDPKQHYCDIHGDYYAWVDECQLCLIEEGSKSTRITSPAHYTRGSIQPYDVIDDWGLNYYLGSAVKYICRAGHKEDEVMDLKKAVEFLSRRIENLEKEDD